MAEFTKERIIEELKASTQNANGMFEISEDTICDLMSLLTCAAPKLPQPAVPDMATVETTYPDVQTNWQDAKIYAEGWNAFRSAMLQAGNSPAVPDTWIPVSERMPADGDIVLVVDDGYFVCEAQHRSGNFYSTARGRDDFFETECRDVAHWMPLPAAPHQEVNRG